MIHISPLIKLFVNATVTKDPGTQTKVFHAAQRQVVTTEKQFSNGIKRFGRPTKHKDYFSCSRLYGVVW